MLIYHPIYKGGTFNFLKFSFSYTGMNHLSTGGRISNFTSIFINLIYLCLVKKRLFIVKLKSLYKIHHR